MQPHLKPIEAPQIFLLPKTLPQVLADLEKYTPEEFAQISPLWIEKLHSRAQLDFWTLGFSILHKLDQVTVGFAVLKDHPIPKASLKLLMESSRNFDSKAMPKKRRQP